MTIKENIHQIKQRITAIAQQCERDPKQIQLIAVSKTKPISAIKEAIEAGQRLFGENYVQEGIAKIEYFQKNHTNLDLEWHFIGPLQSNKSKLVAENFSWVHTIERDKIAKRLNEQRPNHLPAMNVLIQINISNEVSKSGIAPDEMFNLAKIIQELPNLKLRGLMAIPAETTDLQQQIVTFKRMYDLYIQLQNRYENIDTLSMGMTHDMQAAITAGSTMVRIGTAIFGAREYKSAII
ncbi:YggS family pyridoxal phosphate-dependent enzyme [Frischella sp. Ac48]|uniref:Pyridoxal phosphate homeostasis protein n=1 Tax=Frischella japonica TaxID=2741544 RepID=A0ABR7QXG1_9GAMM|nr:MULTISPECIES: YggS family pyridoxal phosphate-dependent enzyme [Frischella]MBC9130909.1 YggS family pyridoxal phosphate-dependent enzyme [Frischella japonica]MBX4133727.1 YggS family pyridoxal phosphate-dependent enzyme [Frischella sp. Ac48]